VLDPFGGTGTTALVCAERGVPADSTDINPFLLWLASAKTQEYSRRDLDLFCQLAARITRVIGARGDRPCWTPDLYQIEKWWDPATLRALVVPWPRFANSTRNGWVERWDLLKVSFCQTMIGHAAVSFGNQSMSFRKKQRSRISAPRWLKPGRGWCAVVSEGAALPLVGRPRILYCDARDPRRRARAGSLCSGDYLAAPTPTA